MFSLGGSNFANTPQLKVDPEYTKRLAYDAPATCTVLFASLQFISLVCSCLCGSCSDSTGACTPLTCVTLPDLYASFCRPKGSTFPILGFLLKCSRFLSQVCGMCLCCRRSTSAYSRPMQTADPSVAYGSATYHYSGRAPTAQRQPGQQSDPRNMSAPSQFILGRGNQAVSTPLGPPRIDLHSTGISSVSVSRQPKNVDTAFAGFERQHPSTQLGPKRPAAASLDRAAASATPTVSKSMSADPS